MRARTERKNVPFVPVTRVRGAVSRQHPDVRQKMEYATSMFLERAVDDHLRLFEHAAQVIRAGSFSA
jgi:hypothetical protein